MLATVTALLAEVNLDALSYDSLTTILDANGFELSDPRFNLWIISVLT